MRALLFKDSNGVIRSSLSVLLIAKDNPYIERTLSIVPCKNNLTVMQIVPSCDFDFERRILPNKQKDFSSDLPLFVENYSLQIPPTPIHDLQVLINLNSENQFVTIQVGTVKITKSASGKDVLSVNSVSDSLNTNPYAKDIEREKKIDFTSIPENHTTSMLVVSCESLDGPVNITIRVYFIK